MSDKTAKPLEPSQTVKEAPEGPIEGVRTSEAGSKESPTTNPTAPAHDEGQLLELATTFLQDPKIRVAPVEEKTAFLSSKGLSAPQIDKALRRQIADTKDSQTMPFQASQPAASASTQPASSPGDLGATTSAPSVPVSQARPTTSQTHSATPIITYPEFLLSQQKPAPLITAERLTTAAYAIATVSAIVYGTSRYLISPTLQALHESRHDFASHAHNRIATLNEKLRSVVSADPSQSAQVSDGPEAAVLDSDEDDASALFSRSYGTQTSPSVNNLTPLIGPTVDATQRSMTLDSNSSSNSSTTAIEQHTPDASLAALGNLRTSLSSQRGMLADEGTAVVEVNTAISDLRTYLLDLSLQRVGTGSGTGIGASSYKSGKSAGKEQDKDKANVDEVAQFRTEIRAFKGVLLSARNFPGVKGK
jgi:hypothetical protein